MSISTNTTYTAGVGTTNADGIVVFEEIYKNPMDTIREGSEDVHVRNYVAYGKTADHKLYLESTYTTQLDQADVEYAFRRGALIIFDGTNYLVPVAMATNKVVTAAMSSGSIAGTEWTAKATA